MTEILIRLFLIRNYNTGGTSLLSPCFKRKRVEESDRRLEINLRIYWYECVLRYSASDCAHEHNVGRQIVALRAGNYYVAANNYSEQKNRRKVQSVIRSLPRNAAMQSQQCSGPKAVICDCDYGHSCQECLRHEIVKFFFITCQVRRAKWDIFFPREGRSTHLSATTCVLRELQCFSFALSWQKKEKSYGQIVIHYARIKINLMRATWQDIASWASRATAARKRRNSAFISLYSTANRTKGIGGTVHLM